MTVIINPGSRITSGANWTNTFEGALEQARAWLATLVEEGVGADVELAVPEAPVEREGRWTFGFRHRVTGVVVELETHGISSMEAYVTENCFHPRVYWNGSSSAEPQLADWAAPGFVQTFRAG